MNEEQFKKELHRLYGLRGYVNNTIYNNESIIGIDIRLDGGKYVTITSDRDLKEAVVVQCSNEMRHVSIISISDEYKDILEVIKFIFKYKLD